MGGTQLTEGQTALVTIIVLIVVGGVIAAAVLLSPSGTFMTTVPPTDTPLVPTMMPTLKSFLPLGLQLANVVTPVFMCTPSTVTMTPTPTPVITDNINNRFGRFAISQDFTTFVSLDNYEVNLPAACNNRPIVYSQVRSTEFRLDEARVTPLGDFQSPLLGATVSNQYAQAAAVSNQGEVFAMTKFGTETQGFVYLYGKSGGSYAALFDTTKAGTILTLPGQSQGTPNALFGKSMIFGGKSGEHLLIGASNNGATNIGTVYTYKPNQDFAPGGETAAYEQDSDIGQTPDPIDQKLQSADFGQAIAIDDDFSVLATTAPSVRSFFVYHRPDSKGGWLRGGSFTETAVDASSQWGTQIAIDSPFSKVIVSDPGDSENMFGRFFLYKLVAANTYQRLQKVEQPLLSSPTITTGLGFGFRMVANRDLRAVAITAVVNSGTTNFQNFVYLYRMDYDKEQYFENTTVDPQFLPLPNNSSFSMGMYFDTDTLTFLVSQQRDNRVDIYNSEAVLS